jgi:hypothetical protein
VFLTVSCFASLGYSVDDIYSKLGAAQKQYDEVTTEINDADINKRKLEDSLNLRYDEHKAYQRGIGIDMTNDFIGNLEFAGATGQMNIRHEDQTITISVNPKSDDSITDFSQSETKQLSGGERR